MTIPSTLTASLYSYICYIFKPFQHVCKLHTTLFRHMLNMEFARTADKKPSSNLLRQTDPPGKPTLGHVMPRTYLWQSCCVAWMSMGESYMIRIHHGNLRVPPFGGELPLGNIRPPRISSSPCESFNQKVALFLPQIRTQCWSSFLRSCQTRPARPKAWRHGWSPSKGWHQDNSWNGWIFQRHLAHWRAKLWWIRLFSRWFLRSYYEPHTLTHAQKKQWIMMNPIPLQLVRNGFTWWARAIIAI